MLRSIGAVFGGLVVVVVLSHGTDTALRGHDVVVAVEVDDRRPRPMPSEETVLDPARC